MFTEKRLLFFAKMSPSSVEGEALSETKKQVSGIEKSLKQGQTPEAAVSMARFMVGEIIKTAQEKLGHDWELRKNQKEYLDYLTRLDDIGKKARREIKENMDRYEKIGKFVTKRTGALIIYENSKKHYDRDVRGKFSIQLIPQLDDTVAGLFQLMASVEEIDVTGTGLDEEKNKLRDTIEAQITLFQGEPQRIIDYHKEQIATAEKHATMLKAISEQGRFWAGNPPYSDAAAREAWQRVFYLQKMQREAAATPGAFKLADLAQATLERLTPALIEWDEKHSSDETFADRDKMLGKYRRAETNYNNARANFEAVSRKPDVPRAEIEKARSWLIGAEQTANEQLALMEKAVASMQQKKGETPVDLDEERRYYASIRRGVVVNAPFEEPEKEAPVMVAEEKAPAEAKPEGKKKA